MINKSYGQDEIIIKKTGNPLDYDIKILEVKNDTIYYKAFRKMKKISLPEVETYTIAKIQRDTTLIYNRNTVFIEFLGSAASRGSINYEKLFLRNYAIDKKIISLRVGFFHAPKELNRYTIPILINFISGRKNHHSEIGFGQTLEFEQREYDNHKLIPVVGIAANFGYRYQKPNGHFVFRAGYTPVFLYGAFKYQFGIEKLIYIINVGLSLGYSF